ncbi:hypothetical protein JRI60_08685 [Archangium violaceum]|uniref:hypothetical protein n=1 Tax=Archangium violaceum TaxID=83451 RepID=UPI0019514A02|nr:hypothetical protein [Archangium violaceum]QRN99080.1 hypothetical protein JRI60_08685 [Archangium violaceum]
MTDDRFWWPFELSPREERAFLAFRERMRREPCTLDTRSTQLAADLLAHAMARHVADVLERDSLPHLGHIINGWGNARLGKRTMLEGLERFVHRDEARRPFILQRDVEGEFHPWQSFAYVVMAGVEPGLPLPTVGTSFREIALNSRQLNVTDGIELGHQLYALAYLEPEPRQAPFFMGQQALDVRGLMEQAVDAHHHGGFQVCRKVHLTEGLCTAAARIRGLESFREPAQGFLEGQLDILFLLGAVLEQVEALSASGAPAEPGTLLHELRDTLIIDNLLENHCYYAGHVIELAGLAHMAGYAISPEHWSAMAFVANRLNQIFPRYLPHVTFEEYFLHFGHYRRAITLLLEVERARAEGRPVALADLARFTVDFDHLPALPEGVSLERVGPPPAQDALFCLAPTPPGGRPGFEQIVAHYTRQARPLLEARGRFNHFRRVGPPSWPRALHYELLDYGEQVGAEIHLESEAVRPLSERLRALTERVARRFPGNTVEWDSDWSRQRGRLRLLFAPQTPPETVAAGLQALIDETYPELDALASNLVVPLSERPLVTSPSRPALSSH